MNAVTNNSYTLAWRRIGEEIARPKAILSISAHWYVRGTGVTISAAPWMIHDFGGFPQELYEVQYLAPGAPDLARRVQQLLEPLPVTLDDRWGLDHGTWSVLCHVYRQAGVPVVQLSIDATQPASFHFEVGQRLAQLREERVLIVGSGNLVHNLRSYAWGGEKSEPYEWAVRFETEARNMMRAGEFKPLIEYEKLGPDAVLPASWRDAPGRAFPIAHRVWLFAVAQCAPGTSHSACLGTGFPRREPPELGAIAGGH